MLYTEEVIPTFVPNDMPDLSALFFNESKYENMNPILKIFFRAAPIGVGVLYFIKSRQPKLWKKLLIAAGIWTGASVIEAMIIAPLFLTSKPSMAYLPKQPFKTARTIPSATVQKPIPGGAQTAVQPIVPGGSA